MQRRCLTGRFTPRPAELMACDIPWAAESEKGGQSGFRIMTMVMEGKRLEVPPASALPGGGFKGLPDYVKLMERCWAQAPEDRPASFAEVIAELRKIKV